MEIMIEELQLLWDHGILVDGVTWRVALVNGIWDGPGYQKVTKTMGANSEKGCNACDFSGVYFGNTMKYPFYARYSPSGDPRRDRRPSGVPNAAVMYNIETTGAPRPKFRNYGVYLQQCQQVEDGNVDASVYGVHGRWHLSDLSYAPYIHPTKDSMHSANNTIRDSLKVLKPNTTVPSKFENRTRRPASISSCQEFRIFPFVYAEHPTFPWILTPQDIIEHDNRFKHVLGTQQFTQYSLEFTKY
jgi:hypothetical protein